MKYDDRGQPVRYYPDGPASRNQRGGIQHELDRLRADDRAGRLALVGTLAGRAVTSSADLSAGEAGRVVRALAGCGTLADAYRLADEPRRARQWARMRARLARQLGERMVADHGTTER